MSLSLKRWIKLGFTSKQAAELARLDAGGCSYRSYWWASGMAAGSLNFSLATLEEGGGSAFAINGSHRLVAQAEGLYTVAFQATLSNPAGGTYIGFSFSDAASPSWGPPIRMPLLGSNRVGVQVAYRLPADDELSFSLSTDATDTSFSSVYCWATGPA